VAAEVRADADLCMGAGNCARVAPTVFASDPDTGLVVIRSPRPTGDADTAARTAVRDCPVSALAVWDV
jgi:ferredoxin